MGEQCPTKNPVQDRSKHCGWGVIRQLLEGRDGWEELGFIERRALQGGGTAKANAWKEEPAQNSGWHRVGAQDIRVE